MKTKFLVAVLASAAMIVQVKAGGVRGGAGGARGGAVARPSAVAHGGAVARAPMRSGGISSFRPMPARGFGGGTMYPRQRSSFGIRSYRPNQFGQSSIYRNPRVTFTHSGPYTAATIRQPNQSNRFPRFANYGNRPATNAWTQRNTGNQFRNGNNFRNANNHIRRDWQRHVFASRSGDWHRDWDRHCDHWWNGHRCSFINGSWVIFSTGFAPWWPWAWTPPDYFAYGSPYSGYNSPDYGYGYDYPYSYDYQPGSYDSGDYQGQMYYDQNSYPDQSQGYYDSSVYQTEGDSDPNGYQDYSNYRTVAAAQERLAREGYYRGETDGALSAEMQKALRRYQRTNGLQPTGYLDGDTLALMGLR